MVRELVDRVRTGWRDQSVRWVGRTGTEIGLVDNVVRLEGVESLDNGGGH